MGENKLFASTLALDKSKSVDSFRQTQVSMTRGFPILKADPMAFGAKL